MEGWNDCPDLTAHQPQGSSSSTRSKRRTQRPKPAAVPFHAQPNTSSTENSNDETILSLESLQSLLESVVEKSNLISEEKASIQDDILRNYESMETKHKSFILKTLAGLADNRVRETRKAIVIYMMSNPTAKPWAAGLKKLADESNE